MDTADISPTLRRSPRFQRREDSHSLSSSAVYQNLSKPDSSGRRRLQFHESLEPVSIPSSIDARASNLPSSGNIAITTPPDIQPERPSDVRGVDATPQRESDAVLQVQNNYSTGEESEDGVILLEKENENLAGQIRISRADETSRLFTFLSQLPVKKLRIILNNWEWRQSGKKDSLVSKAMLQRQLSKLAGKNFAETMDSQEETSRFKPWLRSKLIRDENYPVWIDKVPKEEALVQLLSDVERNEYVRRKISIERARSGLGRIVESHVRDSMAQQNCSREQPSDAYDPGRADKGTEGTNFGLNEFARLLIILRDDEDARSALIAMGQELTRAQLDAGVSRADLWGIVESRFNDPSQERFLSLTGYVDGVDSTLPPLAHRTATFLKDKFYDAKADFTQYVSRWSASGQNDPERFRHFLPKLQSGVLTALGKRMMVMFVCTRKGTPFEEEHFSNLCCKLIPDDGGCDEGSRIGSSFFDRRSSGQGRKKRSQPEDGVKDIASSLSKIATCYESRRKTNETNENENQLKDYSCRLKKIKILEDVVKRISQQPGVSSFQQDSDASVLLALRKLQRDVSKDILSGSEDQEHP